jgi:hypothetical protein
MTRERKTRAILAEHMRQGHCSLFVRARRLFDLERPGSITQLIRLVSGIQLSGLGRVARPVNHNLSRLWPLVGTTSCARSAQMNTPEACNPVRRCFIRGSSITRGSPGKIQPEWGRESQLS